MSDVEYKAFSRDFDCDPEGKKVLFVVATMSRPERGWRFNLVPQAGHPEHWRLLERRPNYSDGSVTCYTASGSTEHEVAVPKQITVIGPHGEATVDVQPW